jgi:hypothetical protein
MVIVTIIITIIIIVFAVLLFLFLLTFLVVYVFAPKAFLPELMNSAEIVQGQTFLHSFYIPVKWRKSLIHCAVTVFERVIM